MEVSAGLLMYHIENGKIKVFLGHVGGPFFKNKDEGAWGVPKGKVEMDENGDSEKLLETAFREFEEETGIKLNLNRNNFIDLGTVKRRNGKIVRVWAFLGSGKEKFVKSNYFEMEWPPKSGRIEKFVEIDKAKYIDLNEARKKIHKFQVPLLNKLREEIRKKGLKEEKQRRLF